MSKVAFVGLSGKAGSGKDTAADYLVEKYGFVKFAFADPIKDGLQAMFNLDYEMLYGSLREAKLEDLQTTPRIMAQTLGTEWGRNLIHPDVWVIALQRKITDYIESTLAITPDADIKIVVSDVRFENEASWIRQGLGGGIVVHVERGEYGQLVGIDGHASERLILEEEQDVHMYNCDTIESFYLSLDSFKEQILDGGKQPRDGMVTKQGVVEEETR